MTRSHGVLSPLLSLAVALGVGIFAASPAVQARPLKSAAPSSRNVPDSFLPSPAQSLPRLLAQVQSNPTVRRRYAAYFHVPASRVAAYMRANLVVRRLAQTGRYTVFYVRPNGLIYPTMLILPKGSTVFALKDGPPVMTAQEGNPLKRYTTAEEIHLVRGNSSSTEIKVAGQEEEQIIVPTQVQETVVTTVEQTPIYQPSATDLSGTAPTEPAATNKP